MVYSPLMRRLRRCGVFFALLSAVALLTATACGEEAAAPATPGEETATAPSPTAAPPTATATAAPEPTTPFQGSREPVEAPASPGLPLGGALLVDVRAARHEGFDRIVFEFQGGLPGYRVEYQAPPILGDASGEPVEIAGNAFLRIRFEPAAAHDPNTGSQTYTGPRELSPGLPSLIEAQETGDFEAVLTWALGLSQEEDFRVYQLQDPFRIAIDVAHP